MAVQPITDLLDSVLFDMDRNFQREAQQWPLVKRNRAIVARNRNMKQISAMLDIPYTEIQLEQLETV
jgi:hypothetical protein